MAQPNKPAKAMSSRLANMKFMQRGSTTPSSSPATPSEPPSKRQRLSNGLASSTPSSTPRSRTEFSSDAGDSQRRTEAERGALPHRGETKWYIDVKESPSVREAPLRIVSAGYSMLDGAVSSSAAEANGNDELDTPQLHGRKSFGRFNRRLEKQQKPDASLSESSSSSEDEDEDEEGDGDESDDPTGAKALIAQSRREAGDRARAERKAHRKAQQAESSRLADERRKKEVKLNKLTSISGGGGTPSRLPSGRDMACFRCGEKGHMQKDCPHSSQQRYTSR